MIALLPWIDAIETRNGRNPKRLNLPAIRFAKEHQLPGTTDSDGHSLREFREIRLELPDFSDSDSGCHSIRGGSSSLRPFVFALCGPEQKALQKSNIQKRLIDVSPLDLMRGGIKIDMLKSSAVARWRNRQTQQT